jgi:hypothetical protein
LLKNSKIVLLVTLFFAGSTWFYVQGIMIPFQETDAAIHGRPRGNFSDLYPRWLGARELLLHNRDPYSPEITREIQIGYYGRPLDSAHPGDPIDEQRFAYPVYVVFLLAPTINLPFPVVRAIFGWLLILLICLNVLLWLKVLRWEPPLVIAASLIIFTLGYFPVVQGLKLQQLTLLVGSFITGSVLLIVSGELLFAGILLALATIKPQLTLLISLWLLLWAFSDWPTRKRFIFGFCITMAVLLLGAQYVLPCWIGRFREALIAYHQYIGGGGGLLDTITTPLIGKALAVLILLALGFVCWKVRQTDAVSLAFSFTSVLVLVVTTIVIPMTAIYNHVLLLPAMYFALHRRNLLWGTSPVIKIIYLLSFGTIFWPWVATAMLFLSRCFLPPEVIQHAWALPLYTTLAIPLAVLTLLIPQVFTVCRRVSLP